MIDLYEDKLQEALERAKEARRQAAAAPAPTLVDASAAFVGIECASDFAHDKAVRVGEVFPRHPFFPDLAFDDMPSHHALCLL